jgi:hypothetical protein
MLSKLEVQNMNVELEQVEKIQKREIRLARRAEKSSVVLALPQPGGADILRAKKQLKQSLR